MRGTEAGCISSDYSMPRVRPIRVRWWPSVMCSGSPPSGFVMAATCSRSTPDCALDDGRCALLDGSGQLRVKDSQAGAVIYHASIGPMATGGADEHLPSTARFHRWT